MIRLTIVMLVAMLLAGCAEVSEPDAIIEAPGVPTAKPSGFSGFELTSAPLENMAPEWTVSGTTDAPIQLIISVFDNAVVNTNIEAGNWTESIRLDGYGWNTIVIDAVAESGSMAFELEVNSFAPATIEMDYGAGGPDSLSDSIWVNTIDFAAHAMYAEQGATHAGYVNIHDALVTWESQHGHEIEYSFNEGFGSFSVERIDGHGNGLDAGEPPWWCYHLNGERPGQGISIQRFTPGDVIAWDLGACT